MLTIEILLLILESVLLVTSIILLVLSIKEGRFREELLEKMVNTTKILSREDYFTTLITALQEAKEEVFGCITGRTPPTDDLEHIESIVQQIERITKKGVHVKYIIPKFPDRLYIGYRYMKAGAEVRYSKHLFLSDHRSTVIDNKTVILGIPEDKGEEEPTKRGFRIPSEELAITLKDRYSDKLESSITFKKYLKEVLKETGGSIEFLAAEMGIEEKDIDSILRSKAHHQKSHAR